MRCCGSTLVLLSVLVLCSSCTGALGSEVSALAYRAVPATIEYHVIQPTWLQLRCVHHVHLFRSRHASFSKLRGPYFGILPVSEYASCLRDTEDLSVAIAQGAKVFLASGIADNMDVDVSSWLAVATPRSRFALRCDCFLYSIYHIMYQSRRHALLPSPNFSSTSPRATNHQVHYITEP